jgi:hypothetical protein
MVNYLLGVKTKRKTPWPQSASELYRPRKCRLLAKLVPTFANKGCCVVSATDSCGRILGFLDRSRYFLFQVAPPVIFTRLSGPRCRPIISQKLW